MIKFLPFLPRFTCVTRFSTFEVDPVLCQVRTIFPDGLVTYGLRNLSNAQNVREARAQGYTDLLDSNAVWRSLVYHELLHSIVAECLWNSPSRVLRTEAGGEFVPSWLRYEEEMIALAIQAWLNHIKSGNPPNHSSESVLALYEPSKIASVLSVFSKHQKAVGF